MMRECEISAFIFLQSLLEEIELDDEDPDFESIQASLLEHRLITTVRIVQEVNPKVLCDKVITHWNLSAEVEGKPEFRVEPVIDDDVADNGSANPIVRPKREMYSETYTLEAQQDHSLEIAFRSWALFDAIISSAEIEHPNFRETEKSIERERDPPEIFNLTLWKSADDKIFRKFTADVSEMHASGNKYLHFLFGSVEVVRGQSGAARLQKLHFLVPKSIRVLKDHALVEEWQESCWKNKVDRSGNEPKLDSFAEAVQQEYVSFVNLQYDLKCSLWPLNVAGDAIALAQYVGALLTTAIAVLTVFLYTGAYTKHPVVDQEDHFVKPWHLDLIRMIGLLQLATMMMWTVFYVLAFSTYTIATSMDGWKEDHKREVKQLQNDPVWYYMLQFQFFISDPKLLICCLYTTISYLGCFVNVLFFAPLMIDVCGRVGIVAKAIEAITITWQQLVGTIFFSCVFQYIFLVTGLMIFPVGYGFADHPEVYQCQNMVECLYAHFDYGFRSAPVWQDENLNWIQFTFDYVYNLMIILILVAIISGIIIDTFADMRASANEMDEDQKGKCFICCQEQPQLERQGVDFQEHIYNAHYMWAYARFFLHLSEAPDCDLNGPETYIKSQLSEQNTTFFPIERCLESEKEAADVSISDNPAKLKHVHPILDEAKVVATTTDKLKMTASESMAEVKELREAVASLLVKIGTIQTSATELTAQAAANGEGEAAAAAAAATAAAAPGGGGGAGAAARPS